MAAIGTVLMGEVLGKSAAEKDFRLWGNSVGDYLIYGLVMFMLRWLFLEDLYRGPVSKN